MSARSTSSSPPPAACSSSRSRAIRAGPPTTAPPGCSGDERTRTFENPLHFTDLKAKELNARLQRAADALGLKCASRGRGRRLPVRREPALRLRRVPEAARVRPGWSKKQTSLPGIWEGFLNQPPASERNRVTPTLSRQLRSSCSRSASRDCTRSARLAPTSWHRGPSTPAPPGRTTSPTTRAARRPAAPGRFTCRSWTRPRTTRGPRSAPPAGSTSPCRASPTTASSGPSSTATNC